MKSKINGTVAVMKFVTVNLIVIIHSGMPYGSGRLLSGSYIFCDFLFMIMGYYGIFTVVEGEHAKEPSDYVKNRLMKWFPWVVIETMILFLVHVLRSGFKMSLLVGAVYDISFLQVFIPGVYIMNGALWFLQGALWGGAIVIAIACIKKIKEELLLWGAVPVVIYSSFLVRAGHLEDWWDTKVWVVVSDSLPRAVAGISAGVLAHFFVNKLKRLQWNRVILRIITWGAFGVSVYLTTIWYRTRVDFLHLVLFMVILIFNGLDGNYLEGKVIKYVNDITFYVYLGQMIVINVVLYFGGEIKSIFLLGIVLLLNFTFANVMLLGKKAFKKIVKNGR